MKQETETAYFAKLNKNDTIESYEEEILKGEYDAQQVIIKKVLEVDFHTYIGMQHSFLDDFDGWEKIGGHELLDTAKEDNPEMFEKVRAEKSFLSLNEEERQFFKENCAREVVKVTHKNNSFYVDTQGYNYARYVGLTQDHFDELMRL